ncbi:MAG: hypothetical protein KatS3mg090_0545 [Patescibacteria group bacterium]|nr:MAG: hypothetical protein KatS3mg090_0545 [Patescibacteria group bacterium]
MVKTKGRLLDYESDNIIEITPNYKEKFKYKFTIRDANNNNIVFYYKPEDLSLVKFYRKTDTFLEEASFNSIKVGDQIENYRSL